MKIIILALLFISCGSGEKPVEKKNPNPDIQARIELSNEDLVRKIILEQFEEDVISIQIDELHDISSSSSSYKWKLENIRDEYQFDTKEKTTGYISVSQVIPSELTKDTIEDFDNDALGLKVSFITSEENQNLVNEAIKIEDASHITPLEIIPGESEALVQDIFSSEYDIVLDRDITVLNNINSNSTARPLSTLISEMANASPEAKYLFFYSSEKIYMVFLFKTTIENVETRFVQISQYKKILD